MKKTFAIATTALTLCTTSAMAAETTTDKKPYSGDIEFGASFETGNTEAQNLNLNSSFTYTRNKWQSTTKLEAYNSKENDVRSNEEYRANEQVRFNYSERKYSFAEVDYVNDRFSGYDYRVTELVGYGRHILNRGTFKLNGEIAGGARQSKLQNNDTENEPVAKLELNATFDLNEHVGMGSNLSSVIGSDAIVTESDSWIKSKLTETLYLKLGFNAEHISDVPAGRENIDTKTTVTVGYSF